MTARIAGSCWELRTPEGCCSYGANAVYLSLAAQWSGYTDTEIIEGLVPLISMIPGLCILNAFPHDQDLKEMPDYVIWLSSKADAIVSDWELVR